MFFRVSEEGLEVVLGDFGGARKVKARAEDRAKNKGIPATPSYSNMNLLMGYLEAGKNMSAEEGDNLLYMSDSFQLVSSLMVMTGGPEATPAPVENPGDEEEARVALQGARKDKISNFVGGLKKDGKDPDLANQLGEALEKIYVNPMENVQDARELVATINNLLTQLA